MAEAQLRAYHPTLNDPVADWLLGGGRLPMKTRRPVGPRHYDFDGSHIAGYDPETGMVVDHGSTWQRRRRQACAPGWRSAQEPAAMFAACKT